MPVCLQEQPPYPGGCLQSCGGFHKKSRFSFHPLCSQGLFSYLYSLKGENLQRRIFPSEARRSQVPEVLPMALEVPQPLFPLLLPALLGPVPDLIFRACPHQIPGLLSCPPEALVPDGVPFP